MFKLFCHSLIWMPEVFAYVFTFYYRTVIVIGAYKQKQKIGISKLGLNFDKKSDKIPNNHQAFIANNIEEYLIALIKCPSY